MTSSRSSAAPIVVIGAGAAGLAAAGELRGAGRDVLVRDVIVRDVLILEARDRPGGRAHTHRLDGGHLVDLGCEWMHSADRNVLTERAEAAGLAIDRSPPPWERRTPQPNFDAAAQEDFAKASQAFYARLAEAARAGVDRPAATCLEPGGRWNALLGAVSTYYNGAPLDRVSVLDFDRYIDTDVDWRLEGGYGAFIASFAADLPIRYGCVVTRIDATGRDLVVETSQGTLAASAAIVTLPTGVLASGAVRFDPPLADHLQAAADLPLGVADKLYFELDGAEAFEPDSRLLGAIDRVDTGSYTIRPRGRRLVEGYFGGDYARELERGGLPAFEAAARAEIVAAYGSDFGRRLRALTATFWARDPFSRGSYSHALPGHADARARLATPAADGRILFAGEATSPRFFSTAHGAFEEGQRAGRMLTAVDPAASAAARP